MLSGQRVSTVHQFRLSQLQRTPTFIIFNIQGLLKQTRQHKRDLPIHYHAFPHDVTLCPVATIESSLHAWATMVNAAINDEFLLCYGNPHGPAPHDTPTRWVRMILHQRGVDLTTFTAHS